MFGNLFKAAVGVVVLPVATVVDLACLPGRAFDNKPPFDSTEKIAKAIADNVKKAVEP